MPVLFHLDDYYQCMLSKEATFCTFTFELQPLHSEKESDIWKIISKVSSDPRNYRHDRLRHGICIATTCPNSSKSLNMTSISKGIELCYKEKYNYLGLKGKLQTFPAKQQKMNIQSIYSIL
ncbi:hypothetical protein NQ317_002785 [Molorchus minor]|uniref:Uncharacterized protein n=1 Tax=Molorchus minor TaxID=1323400 RepID=A0ABQ9J5C1_9CUCU|nr:hypothetical protein NQ317_002785 [Molorchus minor]